MILQIINSYLYGRNIECRVTGMIPNSSNGKMRDLTMRTMNQSTGLFVIPMDVPRHTAIPILAIQDLVIPAEMTRVFVIPGITIHQAAILEHVIRGNFGPSIDGLFISNVKKEPEGSSMLVSVTPRLYD